MKQAKYNEIIASLLSEVFGIDLSAEPKLVIQTIPDATISNEYSFVFNGAKYANADLTCTKASEPENARDIDYVAFTQDVISDSTINDKDLFQAKCQHGLASMKIPRHYPVHLIQQENTS